MEIDRHAHPDAPERDMERSGELLRAVARGERSAVARVYRPGPTVAFGRLDARLPAFESAAAAARALGFAPVVRLGGGRAAAYHRGCVVVELVTPAATIAEGIEERFAGLAAIVTEALGACGLAVQRGELPGEYCPGRWSLHAGGMKLAGVAQRSIRGAALVSSHVAVEDGAALRRVLTDVYARLGLSWDSQTAGAAEDLLPDLRADAVATALEAAIDARDGGGPGGTPVAG